MASDVDTGRTHYLNAGFDLGLRARPRRLARPRMVRQVDELSVQALLGAGPGDAALLRTTVPDVFLGHLHTCGVPASRVLLHPEIDPRHRFRPFGWSAEAIELNRRHTRPVEHPPETVVRRVNSRSFLLELEVELSPQDPPGAAVRNRAELEALLARAPAESEWVVKSEHGNSGLGNRRMRASRLTTADRKFVDEVLAEDDRLIVEPWRSREHDWCVVFAVPFDRAAMRIHETLYTRDGALIGALFEPSDPETLRDRDELTDVARHVASRLEREGYFGPACFDAFTWKDSHRLRLRPLTDLNCRLPMSDGAYRFWSRSLADRTLYYRFFNRRKLTLPTEFSAGLESLGELGYDAARREGVMLASPLEFAKLAVILVARDRAAILALEREFRDRFES